MKIGFSKPTSDDQEWRALVTEYPGFGYEGLQLKKPQYAEYVDKPEQFLAEYGDAPGVASGVITGGLLDEEGQARLRALFAFGEGVGCERVIFCHSQPREGLSHDDIRGYAKTLSELGRESRDRGVRLSLHHHYNQPVMHREDFDVFFDAVEDEAVTLTIDTAHLVKSGVHDIAGVIRDFHQVLDNMHMKDFADGEFMVLGHGEIDFDPVFTALHDVGYDNWLCADEESGTGDLSGALKECYDFMRNGWESVGGTTQT